MSDPTNIEPLTHSVEDAAKRIGNTSVRTVYNLLACGELKSFKVGKRRRIPDTECQRFVERQMEKASA